MREILFRGKSTDNGKWIEGHYASQRIIMDKEVHYILTNGGYSGFGFSLNKIDPGTVGQYTGLTDKNGVKIFEGDIARIKKFREHCVGKIVFHSKTAGFVVMWDSVVGAYGEKATHTDHLAGSDEIEVIGNIHDNPELVGGNGK